MKYLIELVADPKGLEPAITAIDELNQAEKELKATTSSVSSEQKKMMDDYAAKAKLGKASVDKLMDGYKQLGKAATGAFGGEAIKGATKQAESFRTQLKNSREELTKLFVSGNATTQQIYEAARGAGNLKDNIGDAQQAISVLASDTFKLDAALQGVQVGAAGFQVMTGAAALFGVESEELQKTLVKLNAIMAITNGLKQIQDGLQKQTALSLGLNIAAQKVYSVVVGQSTGAMKGFKIALASTGIGAIILAIGYLIANFDNLKTSSGLIGKSFRAIGDIVNMVISDIKRLTDTLGLTEFAHDEFVKRVSENNDIILSKMEKDHKRKLAIMEIQGKETLKTQLKFLQEELKQSRKNNEWDDEQTEAGKERIAKQTELEESIILLKAKIAQKGIDDSKKAQEEADKKRDEAEKERIKKLNDDNDEILSNIEKYLEKENKLRESYRDAEKDNDEKWRKELNERNDETLNSIEKYLEKESKLMKSYRDAEDEYDEKWRKDKKDKELAIKEASIQIAQQTADAIFTIANQRRNAEFNLQIQQLTDLKNKELANKELTDAQKERIELRYQRQVAAIKTKQAQADKQAAIAQAIINGALAITKLWVSPGFPAAIPLAAVVAVTTAAQVAIIAAQKIPKFAKGTEYVQGGGTETSDSVPAMLSKGERVIDAKTNKLLKGIPNKMLPQLLIPDVSSAVNGSNFDYNKMAKVFSKELANNPALMVNFDKNGFNTFIKNGVTVSQIKNNRNGV